MARTTRSSKRKHSPDQHIRSPSKYPRTDDDDDLPVPDDLPIDARPLLAVLEQEDHQGLLDRVFPGQSLSLRALLTTPTPVRLLRSAISHLRPISSLPRATLSAPAAQQLRFCNLALDILDQHPSSFLHLARLPSPSPPVSPSASYALVQHLPNADYWSSLIHLDAPPKDLHSAHAELVAVFPEPSSSHTPPPTLATYSTKPLSVQKPSTLPSRTLTTGAFLDYGLYTSFAPSFDQDGELVGRHQLAQVLSYRQDRKRVEHRHTTVPHPPVPSPPPCDPSLSPDLQLESFLPAEDVDAIKAALNSLELEKSVQDLLDRNQRALQRLEELQLDRLTKHPTTTADEDSEEWETAHAILDSLTLLASLRPRSSSQDSPTIIPPPSILHKLHRTLAIEPSPGWHGTLPAGRTTALRDDSTVKVRPGAATPAPVTNTAPAPAPISTTNTFGAYSYAYAQQQSYRPQQAAAYTPYKPGQAPSYYQGYLPATTQQQTYYPPQTYATGTSNQTPYGAATGQQPYPGNYSAWYGQYPAIQSGAASGGGTPQPVSTTPTPTTMASSYGNFFNTTAGNTAGTRAIANTVAAAYAQTTTPARTNGSPGPYQTQQSYYANAK